MILKTSGNTVHDQNVTQRADGENQHAMRFSKRIFYNRQFIYYSFTL